MKTLPLVLAAVVLVVVWFAWKEVQKLNQLKADEQSTIDQALKAANATGQANTPVKTTAGKTPVTSPPAASPPAASPPTGKKIRG